MSTKKLYILYWTRTSDAEVKGTAAYLFTYKGSYMTIYRIDMYLRTNRRLGQNYKKTKKAPAAGRRREHGLGRYLQGREGRAR